jgi:hypothetical protein
MQLTTSVKRKLERQLKVSLSILRNSCVVGRSWDQGSLRKIDGGRFTNSYFQRKLFLPLVSTQFYLVAYLLSTGD